MKKNEEKKRGNKIGCWGLGVWGYKGCGGRANLIAQALTTEHKCGGLWGLISANILCCPLPILLFCAFLVSSVLWRQAKATVICLQIGGWSCQGTKYRCPLSRHLSFFRLVLWRKKQKETESPWGQLLQRRRSFFKFSHYYLSPFCCLCVCDFLLLLSFRYILQFIIRFHSTGRIMIIVFPFLLILFLLCYCYTRLLLKVNESPMENTCTVFLFTYFPS